MADTVFESGPISMGSIFNLDTPTLEDPTFDFEQSVGWQPPSAFASANLFEQPHMADYNPQQDGCKLEDLTMNSGFNRGLAPTPPNNESETFEFAIPASKFSHSRTSELTPPNSAIDRPMNLDFFSPEQDPERHLSKKKLSEPRQQLTPDSMSPGRTNSDQSVPQLNTQQGSPYHNTRGKRAAALGSSIATPSSSSSNSSTPPATTRPKRARARKNSAKQTVTQTAAAATSAAQQLQQQQQQQQQLQQDADLNPEEAEKRRQFLERNRLAASKCRQKKKQREQELDNRVRRLRTENKGLRLEKEGLEAEVRRLLGVLAPHVECDRAIRRYCEERRDRAVREAEIASGVGSAGAGAVGDVGGRLLAAIAGEVGSAGSGSVDAGSGAVDGFEGFMEGVEGLDDDGEMDEDDE